MKKTNGHYIKSKEFLMSAKSAQKSGRSISSVCLSVFSTIQMGNALAYRYCGRSFNETNITSLPSVLAKKITMPKIKVLILWGMIGKRDMLPNKISLKQSGNILRKAEDFNRWAEKAL